MTCRRRHFLLPVLAFAWIASSILADNLAKAQQAPSFGKCNATSPFFAQEGGKCTCKAPGLSGSQCSFCKDDSSCAAVLGQEAVCSKTYAFLPSATYKAYSCALSELPGLAKGIVLAHCTYESKSCEVHVVSDDSGNSLAAKQDDFLACNVTQCSFASSDGSFTCDAFACSSSIPLVSQLLKVVSPPFKIACLGGMEGSEGRKCSVVMENLPVKLEATCLTSQCLKSPPTGEPTGPSSDSSEQTSDSSSDNLLLSKAEIVALTSILGLLIALVMVLLLSVFFRQRRNYRYARHSLERNPSTGDYVSTSSIPNFTETLGQGRSLAFHRLRVTLSSVHISDSLGATELPPSLATFKTVILDDISGEFKQGEVSAIMGPSGSGKTTLLNLLAGIRSRSLRISDGEVSYCGQARGEDFRQYCAYVPQQDNLLQSLTVRECIQYSALLRLPQSLSRQAKELRINEVLRELKLSNIADHRVGNPTSKGGISGGERRRVSIGMELVTRPQIILLDEPTSGLDSHTAASLVDTLRDLAARGCIVVLSIHQPSSRVFKSFDRVCVLALGKMVYQGPSTAASSFFESRGYQCPRDENFADYMMEVLSSTERVTDLQKGYNGPLSSGIDFSKQTGTSVGVVVVDEMAEGLIDDQRGQQSYTEWQEKDAMHGARPGLHRPKSGNNVRRKGVMGTFNEFGVLIHRNLLHTLRHKSLLVMHVIISAVLGVCVGFIFQNVAPNLQGFQNRTGAIYFTLSFFGFASFSAMEGIIQERSLFLKETVSHYHGVLSYFLSKAVMDGLFLRTIPSIVFGVIFYHLMGLNADFSRFLLFIFTLVLFNLTAGALCMFISSLSSTISVANLIGIVVYLVLLLFGGFLVSLETVPESVRWMKNSPFFFGFEILICNELKGLLITFNAKGFPELPVRGETFLLTLGVDVGRIRVDLIGLAIYYVVLLVLTYISLALRVSIHRQDSSLAGFVEGMQRWVIPRRGSGSHHQRRDQQYAEQLYSVTNTPQGSNSPQKAL